MRTDLASPRAAPPRRSTAPRGDRTCQLLAPGDEVSLGGTRLYAVVHLAEGRAWLAALDDGSHRLADAVTLQLIRPGFASPQGRA